MIWIYFNAASAGCYNRANNRFVWNVWNDVVQWKMVQSTTCTALWFFPWLVKTMSLWQSLWGSHGWSAVSFGMRPDMACGFAMKWANIHNHNETYNQYVTTNIRWLSMVNYTRNLQCDVDLSPTACSICKSILRHVDLLRTRCKKKKSHAQIVASSIFRFLLLNLHANVMQTISKTSANRFKNMQTSASSIKVT